MKRVVALVIAALFLLSGVIVLARIRAAQAPKPVTMSRFYGLNTANELQAKPGESPDMDNFRITDDYRLKKREGLVPLGIDYSAVVGASKKLSQAEFDSIFDCVALFAQLKYDTKSYLYLSVVFVSATNSHAFIRIDLDTKSALTAVRDFDAFSSPATSAMCFYKNGYLYSLNGSSGSQGFLVWDGWAGYQYTSYVSGTIPKLYVNVKPDLSDRADKAYQPINILTTAREINYYATAGTTTYKLPEVAGELGDIYADGEKVPDGSYELTEGGRAVLFDFPFSAGTSVDVRYFTDTSWSANDIVKCKHAISFGGNQDADMFLWGNPDAPHKMYYTYGGDPEFFAATNYLTFGTADSGITGAAIQNNTLSVFTANGVYSLKTQLDTNPTSLVTTVTYPVTYVKADRGHAYANCDIQVIRNNPFFIGADNSIWELAVSSYRDDRAARYISERVQALLKTLDLSKAFTIDWEAKGEYWLVASNTAVIYNYRNDTWYKFTLPVEASGGLIVEDKLMLYDLTDVYVFDDEALQDGAVPINAYWESPYMDYGASYLNKSVRSMYITMAAEREADSFVRLEYYTSDNENPEKAEFLHEAGEPPKPLYTDISAVGFRHIKYKFVSDKYDAAGQILGFTTPVTYGGYVR